MRQSIAKDTGVRRYMRRVVASLQIIAFAVTVAACAESVKHDEVSAAKGALEFARVVLIENNLTEGYEMLSEGGKRHVPLDKFKQSIAAMHRSEYPERVTALEYEPMAGEKAIYIFLTGQNNHEQFSYRVTLEGTAATGYKVLKIDQGMTFPTLSNQKQSLKPSLSIP